MSTGIFSLLKPENIYVGIEADSWQNAVEKTGHILVKAGFTEARYTQAMVDLIERDGPYLVIAPGIALLHARPEEGVLKPGIVLITLSNPVFFGHSMNDPVWLLIGLAATSNKTHVDALADLALFLSDPDAVENIRSAQTSDKIASVIRETLEKLS